MGDGLDAYRAKRDFESTPEPAGETAEPESALRFVVQEHSARAMHWDLRLEHDGTLASWAVPKGIPVDPKRNHLAVRILRRVHPVDHPVLAAGAEQDVAPADALAVEGDHHLLVAPLVQLVGAAVVDPHRPGAV